MATTLIKIPLTDTKKAEIVGFLARLFDECVKARSTQIESKYVRWMDNYAAKPMEAVRTTPFYRASNFVPQLIRMHCDILSARIFGLILATKPMWNPMSLIDIKHEDKEAFKEWLEYTCRFQLRLPEILDNTIFRAFKTGHVMLKGPWVEDKIWKVSGLDKEGGIQKDEITTDGIHLRPVAFDDLWINPITCQYARDAREIFHRIRLTRAECQWRADNQLWDPEAVKSLLQGGPETNQGTAKESQATEAGMYLTPDVTRPYSAIEATFKYELEPGHTYQLVVTFNPKVRTKDGYLRGYFNPYQKLANPYCEIKFMPREDFIYGYSIPEILEQSQEEQAQIHNARRDSNTIGNIPTFKTKRYADMPNPSAEWYPGKVFVLDNMDDMDVLNLQVNYNPMIDEERFLMSLAEQYTGVQPPMQGYGSGVMQGKRGIYSSQGTLAMLAEGNRRLDIYLQRARYPFHDLGNLIYQSYKQFRPSGSEYTAWGAKGEAIQRIFQFSEPKDFPGFFFNISASDASANREVDRQSLLLMANTMGAYYRQIVEAGTALASLPQEHPLRSILLTVLDGAKDLADRLLFAFDIGDRKRLLPDVRQVLGGSPADGAQDADRRGMPQPEGPLSIEGLSSISQSLTAVTGGGGSSNGGPR